MPIKRGSDGRIIEDISSAPSEADTYRVDGKMPPLPSAKPKPAAEAPEAVDKKAEDKTGKISDKKAELSQDIKKNVRTISSEDTKLLRSSNSPEGADPEASLEVVGWVVIIDGPGKGISREIGYGHNLIGRSETADISLNFGDETISREKQCILTYDSKSRTFFLSPGEGRNVVYLNDTPLLAPSVLTTGDVICVGETLLSFVAFCNENFDWGDEAE